MGLEKRVTIIEVGPRDGFQMEKELISTQTKIEIINDLSSTGIQEIEVTSFVHPKAVPQMSDAEEVVKSIERNKTVKYAALAPNVKGALRAVEAGIDELRVVVVASETYNMHNVKMSVKKSMEGIAEVARFAEGHGLPVVGSIGACFGCPFEGDVEPQKIITLVGQMQQIGINTVVLADSVGMGNPLQVKHLIKEIETSCPGVDIILHFHNTRGMGLANVLAGIEVGVLKYEASIGGLGGCPFALGATGNIGTEDVVHMLAEMGIETGIDLDRLILVGKKLQEKLGRRLSSYILQAGKRSDIGKSVFNK